MSNQANNDSYQFLTLTRAARLVGVARGTLQKKIKTGELPTFEGMVRPADLLRVYPDTRFEDSTALERFTHIKDEAFSSRLRERLLPAPEVLSERLNELGKELAQTRVLVERYKTVIEWLYDKFGGYENSGGDLKQTMGVLRIWLRHEMESGSLTENPLQSFLAKESFLRLMTAHVRLLPSQHEFLVEGSDTLLEAALRAGFSLNYGCSNGNCGLCKARVVSGKTHPVRHHDFVLSEADKNAGCVLMCSHTAVSDLVIEAREIGGTQDIPLQQIEARVKNLEPLGDDILRLHLQTPRTKRLQFLAGQSVRLKLGNETEANYPVASCPCDDRNLHFHIRRIAGNRFTDYVFKKLKPADIVSVQGPAGGFVLREDSPRSLLFIAYGSGFAPVKSLIEHAMALDTAETIHLCWVAPENGLYLHNLCRSWSDALDNFHYTPLTATLGDLTPSLLPFVGNIPELKEHDVYVSGPEAFVATTTLLLLNQGLPENQLVVGYVNMDGQSRATN